MSLAAASAAARVVGSTRNEPAMISTGALLPSVGGRHPTQRRLPALGPGVRNETELVPVRASLALVLGGGEGRRLAPLTQERSKPAMYFGGRYRLVDFVLSNLVNSGYQQIRVLTQYRATSLIRHLSRAWSLGGVLDTSIDPVPAGQNIGPFWFRGTADAIWQNLDLLREMRPRDVAVFGSDHVYKMDVSLMLDAHRERDADLTVATLPGPRSEARNFGCGKVDRNGGAGDFLGKPANRPPR